MKRIKDCFTFIFFTAMAGASEELDVTSVSVCFEDVGVDEELTESDTEEASISLQRLLTGNFSSSVTVSTDHSAKPIPIPSHKRRPVVKCEGGKSVRNIFYFCPSLKNDLFCMHEPFCKSLSEKRQFHQIYSRPRML